MSDRLRRELVRVTQSARDPLLRRDGGAARHPVRGTQMALKQIEESRLRIDRIRQEMRMENRKFMVSAIVAAAALLGVGIAIGRFLLFHA